MTLMPVSKTSFAGFWLTKAGGSRWMAMVSLTSMSPRPSMGSPMTLMARPSMVSPTGTVMGAPVFSTAMPRYRPSVAFRAMQRTTPPPMCFSTSSGVLKAPSVTYSRSRMAGISSMGNCTSTTAPMTCVTNPWLFSSISPYPSSASAPR